jgi:ribonuclease BN (tRNA processing enzyme)
MRITVLGSGAAYARAGGACAGFLVQSDGANIWLDAGNGTLSNLQRHISYRDVDLLFLSHTHADHISDVLPLMYALGFDPVEQPTSLAVHAGDDVIRTLSGPLRGVSHDMFERVFDRRPVSEPFSCGGASFTPFETKHSVPTWGVRFTEGDKTAVYTADTAWFDELPQRCSGADLLICEATFAGALGSPGIHLWAREAGKLATDAGASRLVLTHIWPTIDPEEAVREAATAYSGPVEAAVEGKVYEV